MVLGGCNCASDASGTFLRLDSAECCGASIHAGSNRAIVFAPAVFTRSVDSFPCFPRRGAQNRKLRGDLASTAENPENSRREARLARANLSKPCDFAHDKNGRPTPPLRRVVAGLFPPGGQSPLTNRGEMQSLPSFVTARRRCPEMQRIPICAEPAPAPPKTCPHSIPLWTISTDGGVCEFCPLTADCRVSPSGCRPARRPTVNLTGLAWPAPWE